MKRETYKLQTLETAERGLVSPIPPFFFPQLPSRDSAFSRERHLDKGMAASALEA